MIDPVKIGSITGNNQIQQVGAGNKAGSPISGDSFKEVLAKSLEEVNQLQNTADQKIQKWATGEIPNVDEVMVAVAEANMAFELTMEVRNRIIEAYQEIMRMQV